MSIASALTSLQNDITAAREAITTMGGTVTAGGGSSQLATDIATIPAGGGGGITRYLTLTAEQANSTVALNEVGTWTDHWTIKYSTDNTNWNNYTFGTVITLANAGNYVSFAGIGNSTKLCTDSNYHQFVMTGLIAGSGNCCGLISQDEDTAPNYCFICLFKNCASLTIAPELPARTLGDFCYMQMFRGCTSLVATPFLPAIILRKYCYRTMFMGCTSLKFAYPLLATTLAECCYGEMFQGCSSLKTAPDLHATTLVLNCYWRMFYECSLTSAKIYYSSQFDNTYFSSWMYDVYTTGILYYNGTDTTKGGSAIPYNWTTQSFTP